MTPSISLILPAYNEAQRLPPYLNSIRAYLELTFGSGHEVLVVDDGSDDDTIRLVDEMKSAWPELRSVRMDRNRGKGAALRRGATEVTGEFVLFADADGATPIAEEAKLRQALLRGSAVAIGSRMLNSEGVQRSRLRAFTGGVFARAASQVLDLPVRDTQCGFKMFRGDVCRKLLGHCREPGYLVDLELLLYARRLGFGITEVAVTWHDVPGSKVCLVRDGWKMLRGLWRLRKIALAEESLSRGAPAKVNIVPFGEPPRAGVRPLEAARLAE